MKKLKSDERQIWLSTYAASFAETRDGRIAAIVAAKAVTAFRALPRDFACSMLEDIRMDSIFDEP